MELVRAYLQFKDSRFIGPLERKESLRLDSLEARLVGANLRLVVKIANQFRFYRRNLMDLIQEGNAGLLRAVRKYNPRKGAKLSTYSALWIRAYILKFIIGDMRMVKIGTTRAQRTLFFRMKGLQEKFEGKSVDDISKAIADELGVTKTDVDDMKIRLNSNDTSMDAEMPGEFGGTSLHASVVDKSVLADERVASEEIDTKVSARLTEFERTLKPRDQYIFNKRMLNEEPATLQEIASIFQVTREAIRLIEMRIKRHLRDYLEDTLPPEAIEGC